MRDERTSDELAAEADSAWRLVRIATLQEKVKAGALPADDPELHELIAAEFSDAD